MRVLIPDARFKGGPEIEQAAAPDARFEILNVSASEQVPEESWRRCEALVVYNQVHITPAVAAMLDSCRIVVRAGIGFDKIDVAACAEHGIPVCNCPDYGVTDVADHAFALYLALARGITYFHDALREDLAAGWLPRAAPLIGRVRGRRLGIVGLGRVGTAVLQRARSFDMQVSFHDPFVPAGYEQSVAAERYDSLEELLESADAVSLHVPATRDTEKMIDRAALARMKPGSILINTARGSVVDLDALFDALREGLPAGAALDVLPEEPPDPAHPLIAAYREAADWLQGRLILTPHGAYYSEASLLDMRRKPIETLRLFFEEDRLRNCVNGRQLAAAGHDLSAALTASRWEDLL